MPTAATTSQGTQLKVKISSVYTLIPQIVGFTGPSTTQDFEEITNLDSTGGYKEWLPTLRDGGTVPFTMIWKDGDATQAHLQASNANGTKDDFQIVFSNPTTPNTFTFSAYVSKFEPQAQKGQSLKFSVELKVTGAITVS